MGEVAQRKISKGPVVTLAQRRQKAQLVEGISTEGNPITSVCTHLCLCSSLLYDAGEATTHGDRERNRICTQAHSCAVTKPLLMAQQRTSRARALCCRWT